MRKGARYTIHGIYISETFDSFCTRFKLRPSGWLPRLPKPHGVYRKVVRYGRRDPITGESERTEDFSDYWWSGYDFLFHLVDEERNPFLYKVIGQLYEIRAGVYDYVDFSKMLRRGDPGFPDLSGGLEFSAKMTNKDKDRSSD